MNKDRLKELASEKRFIPGIYNYCDRWCERCPQTSHCLNFAVSEEEFADPETQDIQNEAFWLKLSEAFRDTLELLKEAAKQHGIDLETTDTEQFQEESERKDAMAESHEICRAAKVYSDIVQDRSPALGSKRLMLAGKANANKIDLTLLLRACLLSILSI